MKTTDSIIDSIITSSISIAVESEGQKPEVSNMLIAWLETLAKGEMGHSSNHEVQKRFELLIDVLDINKSNESVS